MKSTKYRQPNYFVGRTIFFPSVEASNIDSDDCKKIYQVSLAYFVLFFRQRDRDGSHKRGRHPFLFSSHGTTTEDYYSSAIM